jgi:hypothetical protein
MLEKLHLLGAGLAVLFFLSAILVFVFRILGRPQVGHWIGYLELLMGIPLIYLLFQAGRMPRPALYAIQVGAMLAFLVVMLLLDYLLKIDFRHNLRAVIAYVVLFFAGTGGLLGLAINAGRPWSLVAIALFWVMAALAFIQRAVTGM